MAYTTLLEAMRSTSPVYLYQLWGRGARDVVTMEEMLKLENYGCVMYTYVRKCELSN